MVSSDSGQDPGVGGVEYWHHSEEGQTEGRLRCEEGQRGQITQSDGRQHIEQKKHEL